MTSLNLAPFWRRRTTRSIKRNVEYRKSSGMVDKKERGDRFQGMSIEGEGKIKGRKRWKWWVDAFRNAFQFSRDSSLSSFPFLARLDWLFRYIKHFLGVASLQPFLLNKYERFRFFRRDESDEIRIGRALLVYLWIIEIRFSCDYWLNICLNIWWKRYNVIGDIIIIRIIA